MFRTIEPSLFEGATLAAEVVDQIQDDHMLVNVAFILTFWPEVLLSTDQECKKQAKTLLEKKNVWLEVFGLLEKLSGFAATSKPIIG